MFSGMAHAIQVHRIWCSVTLRLLRLRPRGGLVADDGCSLGQEVVLHVQSGGEGVDLRIDVVLDAALAAREGGAERFDYLLVWGGGELQLELGTELVLRFGDEVRADVRPGGRVGGLDRELGVREVAHLDLQREHSGKENQ